MKKGLLTVVILVVPAVSHAQDNGLSIQEAVMKISGMVDEENLSQEVLDWFSDLAGSPLNLNTAPVSRLVSSGLFSSYQAAVIDDYRLRSGDILSLRELSALDGFSEELVAAISSFITLDSYTTPGNSSVSSPLMTHRMTYRTGVRMQQGEPETMYGLKYRFICGDRINAGFAAKSSYGTSHFPPEVSSLSVSVHGRKYLDKVIVGDFNLRFGQGLALWTGFSMSGMPSAGSFARNPTGITPYTSYSADGTGPGAAAVFRFGRVGISSFLSMDGLYGNKMPLGFVPGANIAWTGRSGQVSFTWFCRTDREDMGTFSIMKTSMDARYVIKGVDLFSEVSLDCISMVPAALAGAGFPMGEGIRLGFVARYYPGKYEPAFSGPVRSGSKCANEHGTSMSVSHSSGRWVGLKGKTGFGSSVKRFQGSFTMDLSYSPEPRYRVDTSSWQFKSVFAETVRVSPSFGISTRLSCRFRSYHEPLKIDWRTDVEYSSGGWMARMRANALRCSGYSFLSYLEGGWKSPSCSAWLRVGAFIVDNWEDRIYAYERDAPGNFSVPAFYGRGYWVSLVCGTKIFRGGRLYLRAAYTGYPWMATEKEKPGRAELKFQFVVDVSRRKLRVSES